MTKRHSNQPVYTKDAGGLYRNVARLMVKQKLNKIKLRNEDTASRLGITSAELLTFQDELNADGLMLCRRLATQSLYAWPAYGAT